MEPHHDRHSVRPRLLEPILVAAGLTLAVSYRSLEPIWRVGSGLLALGLFMGTAYLVANAAQRRFERRGWGAALLLTLVVTQPVLLALSVLDLPFSRIVLAYELVLLYVALVAAGASQSRLRRVPAALGFFAVAALPTLMGPRGEVSADGGPDGGPTRRYLFTSYHDLSVDAYEVIADETQDGGALTLLPDGRVLLVTGSGEARLLELRDGLEAEEIELGLPIDVETYRALGRRQSEFYRVFDVLYDSGRLYATYVHWDPADNCYALRLAEAAFDGSSVGAWATRFESTPCIPLPHTYNTSGGRMAVLDSSRLLLGVGVFGADDHDADFAGLPGWREGSDYGRLLVLDRTSWRKEVLTVGHRNPDGLLVTADHIWSTENGPQGGDELNLIVPGSDYGWPDVSYGTDYGRKTLWSGRTPGDHSDFVLPAYSWTPSIGVSNLVEVPEGIFSLWRGDLLVGSLSGLGNGRAVFRLRLHEGRPVNVERIPTDSRVRDLLFLPDGGPLVLWDGVRRVRVVQPADHVFSQCAACHVVRNAQHGIGPDLYGVVGAPVARHEAYRYSAALRRYGGTWTPDRLDRFLEDPEREVPGTSMEHDGVRDPAERAGLVDFLSEVTAGRPTP
jgi:cytochrome c2/glucose/arabinose dehydrogenase